MECSFFHVAARFSLFRSNHIITSPRFHQNFFLDMAMRFGKSGRTA